MRHIISILIENEAGALSRVAGLFSARAYNIESLTVGPTEDSTLSRITIVTMGSERIIDQIIKQVDKLIDVVAVNQLTSDLHIEREIVLVKVKACESEQREGLKHLAEVFNGRIIDVTTDSYIIELTEAVVQIDSFIAALAEYEIIETVRSGVSGIARGGNVCEAE